MSRRRLPSETSRAAGETLWRIGLYIRLSREDGAEESESVTNQRIILTEYTERQFAGRHILVDCYTDDGQSGTDDGRPGFQRMLRDVESGRINCIICKNLSRAFRNYSDQGYFLESFFPRFGTRFITLGDPKVDTYADPESVTGMEIPISGLMNDRYAYKTSSDIRRTLDAKRRRGDFIGAFAPYGYIKDPDNKNRLLVDPDAAAVVKDIFRWYVYDSMSKEGIARRLNDLGIPNPAAYKRSRGMKYRNPQSAENDGLWQGTGVAAVLGNEIYTGTMVQGKQRVVSYKIHERAAVPREQWYRVPDTHEPVIGRNLFELARQRQLTDTRSAPGQRQNHLFSGFLKCADCRKAMTRKPSGNHVYYICSTYRRKSKARCTPHTIRLDVLEEAVLAAVRREISGIPDIERLQKEAAGPRESQMRAQALWAAFELRTGELKKTGEMAKELYTDWKNGDITREEYRNYKEELTRRGERIRKAAEAAKKEAEASEREKGAKKQEAADGDPSVEDFLLEGSIRHLTRGILAALVKEIRVHENNEITVVFRFHDPAAALAVSSNSLTASGTSSPSPMRCSIPHQAVLASAQPGVT